MAAEMSSVDALNGIYVMLATIMELLENNKNKEESVSVNDTDQTITSLLKGIVDTKSAKEIKATGEALTELAKGVTDFNKTTTDAINSVSTGLLTLNNTLLTISENANISKNISTLIDNLLNLSTLDILIALNFSNFINTLVNNINIEDTDKKVNDIKGIIDILDAVIGINFKKLVTNLEKLSNNTSFANALGDFLLTLNESLNDEKLKDISKDTAEAIGTLLGSLAAFANVNIKKLSKQFKKRRAKKLGEALGNFILVIVNSAIKGTKDIAESINAIGNLLTPLSNIGMSDKTFNMRKVRKVLSAHNAKSISEFFKIFVENIPGKKYVGEAISSINVLIETLMKIKTKHLITLTALSFLLTGELGKQFGSFFTNLCKIDLTEEEVKNALNIISMFIKLVNTLTITFTVLTLLITFMPMTSLLLAAGLIKYSIKLMKNVVTTLKDIDSKDLEKTNKTINSLTTMIAVLSGSLAILTIIAKTASWEDILSGITMITAVVGLAVGIIVILDKHVKLDKLTDITKTVQSISLLFAAISISLSILIAVSKHSDKATIWSAVGVVSILLAISVGIVFVLTKLDENDKLEHATNALLKISAVIAIISIVSATLLIPIGEKMGPVIKGSAVIIGTIVAMIGLIKLLAISQDDTNSGLKTIGIMVLLYASVALVINMFVIPLVDKGAEIFAGTLLLTLVIGADILLIKWLSSITTDELINAGFSIAAIILTISVTSLMVNYLIVPLGTEEKFMPALKGLGIIGIILVATGLIIGLLSSKLFSEEKMIKVTKTLSELILTMALLGIGVGIITYVAIKAGTNEKDTFEGLGAIATILVGVGLIVWLLSSEKLKKDTLIKGAIALAGLSVLILLLGICLEPIIDLAIKAGTNEKDTFEGLGAIATILVGVAGIITLFGALAGPIGIVMGIGALMLTGLSLVTMLIASSVNSILDIIEKVLKYSISDLTNGKEKIANITDILKDMVWSLANPLLAFATGTAMSFAHDMIPIMKLISILSNQVLEITKNVKIEDIVKFSLIVIGEDNSLIGSMKKIVNEFKSFDGTGSALVIALALRPVLNTISKFIDIVKKVATLSYISGYDRNGKPIFDKLDPTVFGEAAKVVSEGFGTFLTTLQDKFTNWKSLTLLLIPLISDTLSGVVKTVGKFVDIVIKAAKMLIVTGYDDNGKPKYERLDHTVFKDSATAISNGFGNFLSTLSTNMKSLIPIGAYTISAIGKSLKPVVDTVSKFVDTVIKVATLLIIEKYDDKGNPVFTKVEPDIFESSAKIVSELFGIFLTTLKESLPTDYVVLNTLDRLRKSIAPVMEGVSHFVDAILKLSTAMIPDEWNEDGTPKHYKTVNTTDFLIAADVIATLFGEFVTKITENFDDSFWGSKTDAALKAISKSIGPVMDGVGKWTDAIYKLASGIITYEETDEKNPDRVIKKAIKLEKDDYTKAATVITDSFTTFITTLTTKLNKDVLEKAEKAKDAILNSINPIMDAVLKFSNALEPFLKLKDENAVNGSADKFFVYRENFIETIANNIANAFISFVTIISETFGNVSNQETYKQVATAVPTINKILNLIDDATSNLRNIIKHMTDDNNKVLSTGDIVAEQFLKTLKKFTELDTTSVNYTDIYNSYKDYINPMLKEAKLGADYLNNIISLLRDDNVSYPDVIKTFTSIIENMSINSVSVYNRVKDIDFLKIIDMSDTYQHVALKFSLISNIMESSTTNVNNGISLFVDNINKLTNKEINGNIIATSDTIKIYVAELTSFTNLIQTTTSTVKIYVTEIDRARKALLNLDKQIIDNEKARNNALQTFADKVNNIAEAVINLKDSFDALNENKILSQFDNIKTLLDSINTEGTANDINVNVNSLTNSASTISGKPSTNNTGKAITTIQQPIFGNNIKVEFIIDSRVIPGFMNIKLK